MPAAQAMDYVKCEAINKMYGRVDASMSEAMKEASDAYKKENGTKWAYKNKYPKEYAKWKTLMERVSLPYKKKLHKITADYKAAGCD